MEHKFKNKTKEDEKARKPKRNHKANKKNRLFSQERRLNPVPL